MKFEIWYLYVCTVLLLMSTPGPSQLLIMSNSLAFGVVRSAMTTAGDLTANFVQMIVATAGLAYVIEKNQSLIAVIQWVGVIYLLYLGISSLIKQQSLRLQAGGEEEVRSGRSLYFQGFIVSAVNPKAVVFFAALFPQFIDTGEAVVPQFAILSGTYLLLDGMFLMAYAVLATKLSGWLLSNDSAALRCAPGVLMISVAIALSMKTV